MVTVQGWRSEIEDDRCGACCLACGKCNKHKLMIVSIVFCFFGGLGSVCHFSPKTFNKGVFKNNLFVKIQSFGGLLEMWPSES